MPTNYGMGEPMRVIVDPARGGTDKGCRIGELDEKDYTLCFSRFLARRLARAGHRVSLTRDNDRHLTNGARHKIASQFNAEAVLSIHLNKNANSNITGIRAYTFPAGRELGKTLAHFSPVIAHLELFDLIVAPYQSDMLNALKRYDVPAVGLKLGYVSNEAERRRLQSSIYQYLLTSVFTASVCSFAAELGKAGASPGADNRTACSQ